MTDKATPTPTPSPASADSVMAKAMMLVGALDDSCEEATSLPFLEAVTALRAEVERLAAQAAPTEPTVTPAPVAWALGDARYVHSTNLFPAHEFTPDAEHAEEWTPLYDHPPIQTQPSAQAERAPQAVQAGEYPPRPFDNHFDQAFRPDAAQAVRMLTREELNDVALSEQVGWGPGEYVEAVQRKFAEVNGLRIPADGKIGGV